MISLSNMDIAVIAAYFGFIFIVAWFASRPKGEQGHEQSDDYFLAGRNLGWFMIGASLFASNIGSEHLVGLAGSGATSGVPVAQFEILAGFILLLLGWIFTPFYLKSGVHTMPQFLEARYSASARNYLSLISVLAYVLTKISVTIYAGAVIFEAIGLSFWVGAIAIVVATGIYTIFGGLKAVIYTDMVQMFIMIAGSLLVTFIGLNKLGGYTELKSTLGPEFFSLWRPHSDPDFPWTGILFGAPILGVWYWCTDQFIVQRVLSAKNLSQARKGTIFGGFLKMLPLFIFVFPGMICLALSKKGMLTLSSADLALPTIVADVLPFGVKGLVVAGLFAALMSSLSSVFNSCSTLITYDFYKNFNPQASEKKLIVVGQISTLFLVICGLLWIPMMKLVSGQLFKYIQSVQAYISPPIAAVFLLGIFIKRLNHQGAMASLWTGFVLGILRLVLEINKDSLSGLVKSFATINFLHFALLLFIVCTFVLVAVSLMTPPPEKSKVENITYDGKFTSDDDHKVGQDFFLSILLVVVILITWWLFS